jgi:hypothetical protein
MWSESWKERNGSYRGKDTTKYEAETMDVSLVVGVVFHGGWRGGLGDVVRLGGAMRVRGRKGRSGLALMRDRE